MKSLLIIPVLILCVCMTGLMSCAEDELLLPSDSTYMGLYPVDPDFTGDRAFSDYMANRYLKIDGKENRMLFMADSLGFMQVAEVVVPEGENFKSDSYNFGWPVATMTGSTIIVSTQRKMIPGQLDDNSGKGQLLITSHDAGETWSTPVEVQNLQPYGYRVGELSCIGNFEGNIIQKGNGTMITEDQGANWNPYPRAFKFVTREAYGPNGPGIHDHPAFGNIARDAPHLEIQEADLRNSREKLSKGFFQDIGQGVNRAHPEVGLVHLLVTCPKGDSSFRPHPIIDEAVGTNDIERRCIIIKEPEHLKFSGRIYNVYIGHKNLRF